MFLQTLMISLEKFKVSFQQMLFSHQGADDQQGT
jgi:hypothetical protein